MQQVILLGASNLTYGFPLIVESLRASFAEPIELLAAHGHGRSYGMWSRVIVRALPSLKDCQLWRVLESQPVTQEQPVALVTDVGNDLLYGANPTSILSWVEDCVRRLRERQTAVTITGLPISSVKRMSGPRYHATKMCFFPFSGPSWPAMKRMADELDSGLRDLAGTHDCRFVEPKREWYGLDPIHVRQSQRMAAWHEILSKWPGANIAMSKPSFGESLSRWRMKPALRKMAGREQVTQQPVASDENGSTISLF